jgi:bis(5'-nucleosyl)-tetraphosphatase (symmetrical)
MSIYVIGDVQGCFASLQSLLETCNFDQSRDQLWFVGDLVNRGPESLQTLRFIRDLGDSAVVVLGNHDLHLLGVWAGHRQVHHSDTLAPILEAPDCDELMQWLLHRPMAHYEHGVLMVHAGVWPGWTLDETLFHAQELEAALRGPDFEWVFAHLYGSLPAVWSEDLTGADRLRVITNAFTRMRFCHPDGEMEFHHKGRLGSAPKPLVPWFDVPGRKTAGIPIVCGHWSALGLYLREDVWSLDTGCLWGGQLSALKFEAGRLEDRQILQTRCPRVKDPKV